MKLKTEKIFLIKSLSKKNAIRNIWENDYRGADTEKFGHIFGILDINLGQIDNNKIFDIINEGLIRYYNHTMKFDIAFDDFINFLNRRVNQLVERKDLKNNSNIVLGIIKDDQILFSATGSIYAYFLHPQGIKKLFPEPDAPLNVAEKLFSHSLNGEISKGQIVYFANQAFNQTINPFYFEKAVKSHPLPEVVTSISDHILKESEEGGFSAFFFYSKKTNEKKGESESGILELLKKQENTQNSISPSIINNIKVFLKQKSLVAHILRYTILMLKKLYLITKKAILFTGFLLFNAFFIVTNIRGKRKEKSTVITNKLNSIKNSLKDVYRSFTLTSKLILLGIFVVFISSTVLISYNVKAQKIKELKTVNAVKIEQADNLFNEADAHLLFNEKNTAIEKLKTALDILLTVPEEVQDTIYKTAFNKTKERLYSIQNIYEITSFTLIAEIPEDKKFLPTSPLILSGDVLTIIGETSVIQAKTSGQNIGERAFKIGGLEDGRYFYDLLSKVLYTTENQTTLQVAKISSFTSEIKELSLHPNENVKKIALYNNRMYVASSNNRQFSIWKHSPSLTGFGRPTLVINNNLPGQVKIASFGIDGNIYVLFTKNILEKYYKGQKQDWSYDSSGVPGDDEYAIMKVDEEYENIYLGSSHQISILAKNGEFLAHISLPTIDKLTDFVVDESNKTIYLLVDKKVYAFVFNI